MASKSIQGYKMYDNYIAYICTEKIKPDQVQRVEWKPGSNRWKALFFMVDGSVQIKRVIARVGDGNYGQCS